MKSIKTAILYGFLLWLIPFIVAFLAYPLKQTNPPFFETIMPVTLSICAVVFSVLYLKKVELGFITESLKVGFLWLFMPLIIDLGMFMWGPMALSFADYMTDIGLTYLMYLIITFGYGYLLDQKKALS